VILRFSEKFAMFLPQFSTVPIRAEALLLTAGGSLATEWLRQEAAET